MILKRENLNLYFKDYNYYKFGEVCYNLLEVRTELDLQVNSARDC